MRSRTMLPYSLATAIAGVAGCSSRSIPAQSSATSTVSRPASARDMSYLTGPDHRDRPEFASSPVSEGPSESIAAPGAEWQRPAGLSLFAAMQGLEESAGLDPMENLQQASFATEGGDTDPVLSPTGDRIFFASTAHRPNPDIYVKSVTGRAITQLTNDPASDVMPAVSPDGSRVAFASDRGGTWDIYVMNATGGQAVQITADNTHELHPTWSPDGRWLAFCKLGEVSGRWEIWVCDAEQAAAQRFLTLGLFPDWHPSASRVVFQRSRDRGDRLFSIWTFDYSKGEATNLTEIASAADAAFINPKWSTDGEYIAFSAVPGFKGGVFGDAPSAADVYIMKVQGGGLANLTGGRFANLMPTWGPANSVYFTSDRAGVPNIWSVNAEAAILAAAEGRSESSMTRLMTPIRASKVMPLQPMADAEVHGATPAPAQTEHDLPPEIANVPIDDR